MAIPFYATQRIEMKKEKVQSGDPIKEEEGVKIRCRTIKNRVAKGNPYKMCNYYALYGVGIDGTAELGSVLVREGILTKAGAWIRYQDETTGDILKVPSDDGEIEGKWNGIAKFTEFLMCNDCARVFFEKELDKKLSSGSAGVNVSAEEREELEKLNSEIDNAEAAAEKEE